MFYEFGRKRNRVSRKEIISSLKKEIQKANEKDNYLDQEERILIKTFIKKIKNTFDVKIKEVEIIKEDIVFKVPGKLN